MRREIERIRKSTGRDAFGDPLKEVWLKYRAAILERNPALQLLRIVEAYGAIQRRLEKTKKLTRTAKAR
jgi:hypothetical protein